MPQRHDLRVVHDGLLRVAAVDDAPRLHANQVLHLVTKFQRELLSEAQHRSLLQRYLSVVAPAFLAREQRDRVGLPRDALPAVDVDEDVVSVEIRGEDGPELAREDPRRRARGLGDGDVRPSKDAVLDVHHHHDPRDVVLPEPRAHLVDVRKLSHDGVAVRLRGDRLRLQAALAEVRVQFRDADLRVERRVEVHRARRLLGLEVHERVRGDGEDEKRRHVDPKPRRVRVEDERIRHVVLEPALPNHRPLPGRSIENLEREPSARERGHRVASADRVRLFDRRRALDVQLFRVEVDFSLQRARDVRDLPIQKADLVSNRRDLLVAVLNAPSQVPLHLRDLHDVVQALPRLGRRDVFGRERVLLHGTRERSHHLLEHDAILVDDA
eukprot:31007-Pelagococcus_subviridis.AAC.11